MSNKIPITGLIIAQNEELCIERAVRSLAWLDQTIVVDCGSSDRTVELAQAAGATICYYTDYEKWDYSAARNYALNETGIQTEWAFFIDADEICTFQLAQEIERTIKTAAPETAVYRLAGKYMFLNRWMRYTMMYPVWHDRLIRIGAGHFYGTPIEKFLCDADYEPAYMSEPYIHHSFHNSSHWFQKHIRYATDIANEVDWILENVSPLRRLFAKDEMRKSIMLRAVFYKFRAGYLYPLFRFFYMYILHRGFLEGVHGLLLAFMYMLFEAMVAVKVTERRILKKGAESLTQ